MFSPSFSNVLVEARVEQLHRAARNGGRGRRRSGTARHSAPTAFATVVTRTATWSRQS
jgi:hypothetical protein